MSVNPSEGKESRMLSNKMARSLLSTAAVLFSASAFVGCALVPPELTSADQAIAKARQAGKDKECPDEFNAAERLKNEAFALNTLCNERRVIALANEALAKTSALCPPPPPPPPSPCLSRRARPPSNTASARR